MLPSQTERAGHLSASCGTWERKATSYSFPTLTHTFAIPVSHRSRCLDQRQKLKSSKSQWRAPDHCTIFPPGQALSDLVRWFIELMAELPALCYTKIWQPSALASVSACSLAGLPLASKPGTPRPILAPGVTASGSGKPERWKTVTSHPPQKKKVSQAQHTEKAFSHCLTRTQGIHLNNIILQMNGLFILLA